MKLFKIIMQKMDFKRRNIKVWPGAYVYLTAKIGDNVSIGRNAEIGDGVVIGKNVRIGNGAFIPAGVTIEDDVFIGPHAVFTNDMYPPGPKSEWKKTHIQVGAAIGAGCTVRPGVVIGHNARIGCGSVVTKDVPKMETWAGNPAKKLIPSLEKHKARQRDRAFLENLEKT